MWNDILSSMTKDIWEAKIPNPMFEEVPAHHPNHSKYLSGSNRYLPTEIREFIQNTNASKLTYKGASPIDYNVQFFCYGDVCPLESLQRQMKLVIWWLKIANQYAKQSCKDLVLLVFLTPFEKTLPRSTPPPPPDSGKVVLSSINCNTGVSTRCDYGHEITVYREEEWFKVFIHESFHYFGLDFAYDQSASVNSALHRMFCVGTEILLYESYTEFWAEIIVMALFSKIHKESFHTILQRELTHSLQQAKKVLGVQDLTYSDLTATDSHTCSKENTYREETNVCAYYIIKTIFLYFNESFLQWCNTHNTNLLQFDPSTLPSLLEWIEHHYREAGLVAAIEGSTDNGDGLRMTTINI
jgi:hypothetical protein